MSIAVRASVLQSVSHLQEEHRACRKMLRRAVESLDPFDPESLEESIVFLKYVMDRVHHAKEEDALFPMLEAASDEFEPLTLKTMHEQHFHGRSYLKAAEALLEDARQGSEEALRALSETIRAYERFTATHMKQEERVLFPLVEQTLDEAQDNTLLTHFRRVQGHLIDREDYEAYLDLAQDQPEPGTVVEAASEPAPPAVSPPPVSTDARSTVLFDERSHRVLRLADHTFLIVDHDEAVLIDPSNRSFAVTRERLESAKLEFVFLSNADAEVGASLNGWMMESDAKLLAPELTSEAVAHYGVESLVAERLVAVPDDGGILPLGSSDLAVLPAHFLPSPANLQIFDPRSKILFSGALGAAPDAGGVYVEDFDAHMAHVLGLHRRRMGGIALVRAWVAMVRQLDVQTIAPRRGPMYADGMVEQLLAWLDETPCGPDLMGSTLALPTQRIGSRLR